MHFLCIVKCLNLYELEVVVSTESDTVEETATEAIYVVVILHPLVAVVETLTQVRNESNLVANRVSDTRNDRNTYHILVLRELIAIQACAVVSSSIANTTVNESEEVTSLEELITNVRINLKCVSKELCVTSDVLVQLVA